MRYAEASLSISVSRSSVYIRRGCFVSLGKTLTCSRSRVLLGRGLVGGMVPSLRERVFEGVVGL